jgi:hypothetical protein
LLVGELEGARGLLVGALGLAARGERLGRAEVCACRPHQHPLAFLDFDREREVLVGSLVAPKPETTE